jgi:hypothetical protein
MARKGGERAPAGFYWHTAGWEIATLSGDGGVLPGTPEDRYIRVPALAMLMMAPVMGALLVVFLPFIGFALLLGHGARQSGRGARRALARLAASLHRARHAH